MAEAELNKVRKLKHNMTCADCPAKCDPMLGGFGAVVMPFHSFVCNLCKQAHQAYSHRVKSVTMSNWSHEEVDSLRDDNGGGNKNCRKSWHGKGLAKIPPKGSDVNAHKEFVRQVYVEKRFFRALKKKKDKKKKYKKKDKKDKKKKKKKEESESEEEEEEEDDEDEEEEDEDEDEDEDEEDTDEEDEDEDEEEDDVACGGKSMSISPPDAVEPADGVKLMLITGVTSGLGEAMLKWLMQNLPGCIVVGCGRDAAKVKQLQTEFPTCSIMRVDITQEDEVARWASAVVSKYGVPHIVINNASSINQKQQVWNVPSAEFASVLNTNVKAVHNVCYYFVSLMVKLNRGMILNMTSNWGRSVSAMVGPYCSSKWAVEGFTKALALELPEGMAAIPVNPGVANTALLQGCFGVEAAAKAMSPDEWAKESMPFLLALGPSQNGNSLTCPNAPATHYDRTMISDKPSWACGF